MLDRCDNAGDAMILNGYFGYPSIWLVLIVGWAVLAIVSHIVLNIIARYDGRKERGDETLCKSGPMGCAVNANLRDCR